MRRIHSILMVVIVLSAALAAGLAYLNRSVLPGKARRWAEQAASQALGRPVTIERVRLHVWHGFILENINVAEDSRFGSQPILHVDQISGGVLFLPLFKQRQLIIPTLHIAGSHLRLLEDSNGRWNFQTLALKPSAAAPNRHPFGLIIPHLLLSDGVLEADLARGKPTHLELRNWNLEMHLALPAEIDGTTSAQLQGPLPTPLQLRGVYHLKERRFELQSHSNWVLPILLSYLPDGLRSKLGEIKGMAAIDLEVMGVPGGPLDIKGWLETDGFQWNHPEPQPMSAAAKSRSGWRERSLPCRSPNPGAASPACSIWKK